MRGRIYKRHEESDTWTIVVDIGSDPQTGKRKQLSRAVKGTKKEAERKLAEIIQQIDTGTFAKPNKKIIIAEFLRDWQREYVKSNLSPTTARGYDTIIRVHLIPAFGKLQIGQLTPEHIRKYLAGTLENGRVDGHGKSLSARTIKHHLVVLHTALQEAARRGLIPSNPADFVKAPRVPRNEMSTWSTSEVQRFLGAAKNTPYYVPFHVALFTGLSRSELLALRWSDVDLSTRRSNPCQS